jgi:hypothetical protein
MDFIWVGRGRSDKRTNLLHLNINYCNNNICTEGQSSYAPLKNAFSLF